MSTASDDIYDLFPDASTGFKFIIATLVTWDQTNGRCTMWVNGTLLSNLSSVNRPTLTVGDQVLLIPYRGSLVIFGKIVPAT